MAWSAQVLERGFEAAAVLDTADRQLLEMARQDDPTDDPAPA